MCKKALKLLNDSQDNHNSYTVSEFVQTIKPAKHKKTKPSSKLRPFTKVLDKSDQIQADLINQRRLRLAFQYYGSPIWG